MRPNPYIGPRSFTTGERLYGRDRELRRLANLLIAERIVLLYSPSGAGKTSLVQAALVPRLREEGFSVLPPIRVGTELPPELSGANRYVLSTMMAIEGQRPEQEQIPLADLAAMSLDQYLDQIPAAEADGTVLIFDQFEEVLSVAPNDRAAKVQFFEQLGAALRPRERWALFSMREDYIARLDPFLREIPTRLANRLRLDLLESEAAMAAIQAPARAAGVAFTNEAAQQLIDDLRMVRVQRADGSADQDLGLYVEPVQLQVVCYRLWSKLPDGDMEISLEDVGQIGDVTSALRSYYADRVAAAAAAAGVNERAVRDWCDSQLITAQGIRGQVLREHEASGGLANQAIAALIDSHLVRGEQIRGAIWYELAHDRLIGPVQTDNAAWRTANLSRLQHQAALWDNQGRQDGLLLRNDDLADAEVWAVEHQAELTDVEQDFLGRCREVRAIIRRERRNNRLIRGLAVVASIIGVAAAFLAVMAFQSAQEARSRALASAAMADVTIRPQRSLLLALAAQKIGAGNGLFEGEESLQQLLTQVGGRPEQLGFQPATVAFSTNGALLAIYGTDAAGQTRVVVREVGEGGRTRFDIPTDSTFGHLALSPDGALLAGTTATGSLIVWDGDGAQITLQPPPSDAGRLGPIGFSADGALLAAGDDTGRIYLWRSADLGGAVETMTGFAQPVTALAISPDGQKVAFGYRNGRVDLLPRISGGSRYRAFQRHEEQVTSIAFSPDGQTVASGSTDSEVLVRMLRSGVGMFFFRNHTSKITGLQFSPDGRQIISSSSDSTAQIWTPFNTKKIPLVLRGHEGWVLDTSFSTVAEEILTVGRDGTLRHWSVAHPAATTVIHQHGREVASVAYSPDGRWLATGSIDKTGALWVVDDDQVRLTAVMTATGSIWWIAFDSDSSLLASANEDGNVQIWQVATPAAPPVMIEAHPNSISSAVSFSPKGLLASVGYDGALKLWDISQLATTGQAPQVPNMPFPTGGTPLEAVAFSEDGRWLAASGDDGVIQVWDMNDLAAAPLKLSAGQIYVMAFRPGHPGQLAGAGFDARVMLWDLNSADHTPRIFKGHTDWVIGLAFSPDGSRMASAANDKTVRLWQPDQEGGAPLVLRGHTADVKSVSFSRDGRWLASGSMDSTAIIWPIDLAALKERACVTAGRSLTQQEASQIGDQDSTRICGEDMP